MSQIDLNELAKSHKLELSITASQDENPKDANVRRFKEILLVILCTIMVLCAFTYCGYVLINNHSSSDDKKWAMTIAGIIISGSLGYLTGKKAV